MPFPELVLLLAPTPLEDCVKPEGNAFVCPAVLLPKPTLVMFPEDPFIMPLFPECPELIPLMDRFWCELPLPAI